MRISPKELRALASDVDDLHRDSMRSFRSEAEHLHFSPDTAPGRRSFMKKVAAGGAALTIGSSLVPVSSLIPAASAQQLTDADIAVFAESVELAAVEAYKAGAPLLSPEVLPVAELFLRHHEEHANAFASIVPDLATGQPNAALLEALAPVIAGLSDEAGVLAFAQTVENQAVATYAFALTALADPANAGATATILPIESAHAAVLGMALQQPLADLFPHGAFESSAIADGIDPAAYPVA